jgi:hypothetical protein
VLLYSQSINTMRIIKMKNGLFENNEVQLPNSYINLNADITKTLLVYTYNNKLNVTLINGNDYKIFNFQDN